MKSEVSWKLEQLGLTRNEAKIYLALLEIGPTTTKALIERTGIHTSKVYEGLERLVQKGLASFSMEAKRKRFRATDPKSIIGFIEEKEEELGVKKAEFEKMLPSLRSLAQKTHEQYATVFQGLKGYKAMLETMLEDIGEGGKYDAFASGKLKEEVGPYWTHFQSKKKQMHIASRAIWDEKVRSQKDYLGEYFGGGRFIPTGSYSSPTDIFVYRDKIILVSYETEPIFAVLIQSEGMAKGYKELFNALWKTGRP